MTTDEEVQMIPIERIRILNPRLRNRKNFEVIVHSIKTLGLKKPIQVSLRSKSEDGDGYDLVCGQGRIEAFIALGHKEIPAIVVQISREERLLRSLAENMARRFPSTGALIEEIERLKALGYSNLAIGEKLDLADSTIGGLIALKNAGEERLLDAAVRGSIPVTVAIEIAKADDTESQRELLKAYENKQLNGTSIRTVKRLMDQRQFIGKSLARDRTGKSQKSADAMVIAYRKETQRQKMMVRKAKVCEAKLIFLVQVFTRLMVDENFQNLLRAEGLGTMPKYLADKLAEKNAEGK